MNLQLMKQESFHGMVCDFYKDGNNDIYMTAFQLGQVLEYSNPQKGIDNILSKNEYLKNDEFSVTLKLRATDQKLYNTRVFSEDGVYEITFISSQSRAKEFRSWVRTILKGIRKGELILLQQQIEELKPDAEAYHDITNCQNSVDLKKAAKHLKLPFGRNTLYDVLRKNGFLMSDNEPYQKFIDEGLLKAVPKLTTRNGFKTIVYQVFMTAKGLNYFYKYFKKHGYYKKRTA